MIKLGGYTDNTGDPQANLTLSQQRADTVMADLVKLGVDASRMKAEGYGQEHPVADNSTEEGRAKNRRIDIRVTGK
jgi:outer membrane protein OmpA-like peptidoglycan-associated protein